MRNQFVLALFAASLSGAAFAAPGANQDMERAAMASVPVVGSTATYKLSSTYFDGVRGVYELSDGRRLHVTLEHDKLYADVGRGKTQIVPVAPNRFATRDDSLRLAFDQIPFASEVTLSQVAAR
jgi:hypothetical protein